MWDSDEACVDLEGCGCETKVRWAQRNKVAFEREKRNTGGAGVHECREGAGAKLCAKSLGGGTSSSDVK